jgi:hypothetical protein
LFTCVAVADLGALAARLWLHIDRYKRLSFGSLLNGIGVTLSFVMWGRISEEIFSSVLPGQL